MVLLTILFLGGNMGSDIEFNYVWIGGLVFLIVMLVLGMILLFKPEMMKFTDKN